MSRDSDSIAPTNSETDRAVRELHRCDARVRRGTGEAFCDRPLNDRGECDRAGDHIEEGRWSR